MDGPIQAIRYEDVNWIRQAQDSSQTLAIVNTIMDLWVQKKVRNS